MPQVQKASSGAQVPVERCIEIEDETAPAEDSLVFELINATNAGTLTSSDGQPGLNFSGFPNFYGGTGADTFAFTGTGNTTGYIDGGGGPGINKLDYSALSTRVVVNIGGNAATLIKNAQGSRERFGEGGVRRIGKSNRHPFSPFLPFLVALYCST